MKIHFGLTFDDSYTPLSAKTEGGVYYVGPRGFLRILEHDLGLSVISENLDHLRIEWYRQALQKYMSHVSESFFVRSFQADQFAVATTLLEKRDELLLAFPQDWKTEASGSFFISVPDYVAEGMPDRIQALINIEQYYQFFDPPPGFAERFLMVEKYLQHKIISFSEIYLHEPLHLTPEYWQRLFRHFQVRGTSVLEPPVFPVSGTPSNDLTLLQSALSNPETTGRIHLKGDGSLLILKFDREPEAATWFSKILRLNPEYQPVLLLPQKNRILDNALFQEGIPCMGLLSASSARPSIQILRLITVFLWQPLDPARVLEFVNLALKPLDYRIAQVISEMISATPGTHSPQWHSRIAAFWDELKAEKPDINLDEIKRDYSFWFERERYPQNGRVPVGEVFEIFEFLKAWAINTYKDIEKRNKLLSLKEQCEQMLDLLSVLPENEQDLSMLELERLIRTVYKPSPLLYRKRQSGAPDFIYQPASLVSDVDELVWWNFTASETPFFFSFWYPEERTWLEQYGIFLSLPSTENECQLWQRIQPFLKTRRRLMLVVPDLIDGESVSPHQLWANLEGLCYNLAQVVYQPAGLQHVKGLQNFFTLPGSVQLEHLPIEKSGPFIRIPERYQITNRTHETFSSIETLLYYPHQWFFQYFLKLKKSAMLRPLDENTLYGNLSHRIFELLLKQLFDKWNFKTLSDWIDLHGNQIISQEGATLLMYGYDTERISFLNKVKFAAWSLISALRENGWEVFGTEMELAGVFGETPIRAKADLVLVRGDEYAVVDLKWRGEGYRKGLIHNREDIQLVMYSRLLPPVETWMHTAYFIISKAKILVRNNVAFSDVQSIDSDSDHREVNQHIWDKMHKTWAWRLQQLKQGLIEIRHEHTKTDLEDAYGEQLFEVLEMKKTGSVYDDYTVLIGLVQ